MELHNFEPDVVQEIYKISGINLSPNIPGQVALGLMVNQPKPGDYSYNQIVAEKAELLESLKRRARMITDAFNSMDGISCQETEGRITHIAY